MNPWQKQSLAMLTVGVMAMGNVMTPSIARATTAANLTKSADSIEIFVPPPERRTSGVCPDFLGLYIDSIINRPNLQNVEQVAFVPIFWDCISTQSLIVPI